jgi:hypothetical protein
MTYRAPENLTIAELRAEIIGMENTERLGVDGIAMMRRYQTVLDNKLEQSAKEGVQE